MDPKTEILQTIKLLASKQQITKEELLAAYETGRNISILSAKLNIAKILYYCGGAIIFFGIAILVMQHWKTLGLATQILATLGSGITTYIVGILFSTDKRTVSVSSAFYLISALTMPVGLGVVFDHASLDINNFGIESLIFGILLGIYFFSYLIFPRNIFMIFSLIFGTAFFFSLSSFLIGSNPYAEDWKFMEYRVLTIGLSYMLLAYAFSKGKHATLSGFLYSFGMAGFFSAALYLGGWKPHQMFFWELIFPVLVFSALFLSVYLKNKTFLIGGAIFLMIYILKITSEYFSHSLGWPLTLVIAGLAMIAISYLSLHLRRKYLS